MAQLLNPFARAAQTAVAQALKMDPEKFLVSTPPKPEMGDLAVGCFPAAKELKGPPPKFAAQVAEGFEPTELLSEASAAGPFVNFKINREAAFRHTAKAVLGEGELISKEIGAGKTICIDYSSPNISKHLAYHHIRSTVIGHALVNLYRAVGYEVIGINHLGDWGTTHGMLLAAYHKWQPEEPITIETLNDLYVKFRAAMKEDPALEDEGRAWFAKLESGDEEARELWQHFKDVSWAEFQSAYDQLGIEFELVKGESEYVDDMPAVLGMLEEKGLSSMSDGALVVMFDEADDMPPLLLKKKDGATLYGTRDLAAAQFRWKEYAFERNLYVVDRGQGLHFKQLFKTLERCGFEWSSRCQHVPFGLVRLGGKKTGTRSGNVVLLKEVFAEATERASKVVAEANKDMDEETLAKTAQTVGVGAVVFANLMSQREKDVDFDWEDILSTAGDSGAYLQYGHARCCRTLEKSELAPGLDADFSLLDNDAEWALAKRMLSFADSVARAADNNDPHILSRYLLDLGADFSHFYTAGNQDKSARILCDDQATQKARLTLVEATRTVLETGLGILGVGAPRAM